VGLARFELATTGLGNRCSIHLSYSPALPHYITICASSFKTLGCAGAVNHVRPEAAEDWGQVADPEELPY
jgi:hypothetical protein